MRRAGNGSTRGWLAALGFAGIVAAHALSYVVAVPHATQRADVLHETGHGSWELHTLAAIALLIGGIAAFAQSWAVPGRPEIGGRALFASTALRLIGLQMSGFVLLEGIERASAHGAGLSFLTEAPVVLGLVLQVLVGLAGALLLVAVARVVRWALRRRMPSGRSPAPAYASTSRSVPARSLRVSAWNLRGPPSRVV